MDLNYLNSIVIILVIGLFVSRRWKRLDGMPVMSGYGSNHEKALMEGTLKYPATPFIVETSPPIVILPVSMLEELKNIPHSKASFHAEQNKVLLGDYTGLFQHGLQIAASISVDLNRQLPQTLMEVQEEMKYAFEKELGACEDWTTVLLYHKIGRIVARLTSRVFVGPRLARNDEWIDLLLNFTISLIKARDAMKKYPQFTHPIVGRLLPELVYANGQISRAGEMLAPIVRNVMADWANKQPDKKKAGLKVDFEAEDEAPEGSYISWVLKRIKTAEPDALARVQLSLSFAAISTTSNALVFVILDLAARPDYIQPLRDEIEQAIVEDSIEEDENGILKFKQTTLTKLKKMDSFIKESQRMSSKNPISNVRRTTTTLTLPTGHQLQKGTRMAFNAQAIHTSTESPTFSPKNNPPNNKPPTEFDGFRFYNLRGMPGNENKHLHVTVGPDSLGFGYGNHACPGRFFANNEMKVILVELLRKWDFKMSGNGAQVDSMRRLYELVLVPPRKAQIEIRRRSS